MKKLVIIPTYNEKENIPLLFEAIFSLDPSLHILIVDDNSPDGTAQVVEVLKVEKYPGHVHLLNREKKEGLGRAYVAGFKWGLKENYDVITQMDADFSHRPKDLILLLDSIEESDVVIGSRWVPGGGTKDWGLIRKIISLGGSFYSRLVLGYPIRDWTGGFNVWKRDVLKAISLDTIQSEGYSFQIEMKYRASKSGFQIKEVPILFEERRLGQSKMSLKIVIEAFYRIWMIRFA